MNSQIKPIVTTKETIVATVAVAMNESGHSIESINEVCSNIIGLLEFSNPDDIMHRADRVLHECLALTGDLKTADVIPFKARNT